MGSRNLPNLKKIKPEQEILKFLKENRQNISGLLGLTTRELLTDEDKKRIDRFSNNYIEDMLKNFASRGDINKDVRDILDSLFESSKVIVSHNHFRNIHKSKAGLESLLKKWDQASDAIAGIIRKMEDKEAAKIIFNAPDPKPEVKVLSDEEIKSRVADFFNKYDSVIVDITYVLGGHTEQELKDQQNALNKLPELSKELDELIKITGDKHYNKGLKTLAEGAKVAYSGSSNVSNLLNLSSNWYSAARSFNSPPPKHKP